MAIGLVLAFSLVWTLALLVPDDGYRASAAPLTLVVNGTHYVLDPKVSRDQTQAGENVHIIHAASPSIVQRVSTM